MTTYLTPTPRQRLAALAKYLLPLLAVFALSRAARLYTDHVADLPFCEQLPWMRVVIATCVAAVAGCSYLCGRSGFRILRSGQFPAPGSSVLFRTRVRTGWWARANGVAWLLISSLVAAFLVGILDMFVFSEVGPSIVGLRDCGS